YGWTGREVDVETGLQYNRARYYDAATGRWISQDPLGFDAGDSNLYRYVNNGPTDAADPSGLELVAGSTATANRWKQIYSDYLGVTIKANQASSGIWVFDFYSKNRATIEAKIN